MQMPFTFFLLFAIFYFETGDTGGAAVFIKGHEHKRCFVGHAAFARLQVFAPNVDLDFHRCVANRDHFGNQFNHLAQFDGVFKIEAVNGDSGNDTVGVTGSG